MLLDEQTALAREIAEHFGADESAIHDLREDPHAGYRAVHVWLRMPAGRVEIQIRTTLQSLWANTYEGLGDALGRGIRYGDPIEGDQPIHGVPAAKVREVIEAMHRMSAGIARLEAGIEAIQEGYPQKVAAIMAAMARLQASLDSAVARESG
jgi:ppGpp synthetase/RelA/SpoT-type nucleotidyltranferase